eukprot:Gregarina_sp_Poly_1__11105@NODE_897_length_5808_cov_21_397318_g641_i0_p3_GENE_NODE_897_length_5808_cov_21_397318_g641_i0NODE_897_length_5808_cov_21_397318_g641_i0_p3_ORF_typecomplete_len347_score40_90Peptidase_S8/PF00082_22/1_6e15Peptidase_S8_N/PF16361_5/0_022_NODE_897_length_5808_cov_21_397318_g641_i010132053
MIALLFAVTCVAALAGPLLSELQLKNLRSRMRLPIVEAPRLRRLKERPATLKTRRRNLLFNFRNGNLEETNLITEDLSCNGLLSICRNSSISDCFRTLSHDWNDQTNNTLEGQSVFESDVWVSQFMGIGSVSITDSNVGNLDRIIRDVSCHPLVEWVEADEAVYLQDEPDSDNPLYDVRSPRQRSLEKLNLTHPALRKLRRPVKPNDPKLDQQWHLKSQKLFEAWSTNKGDRDVLVLIIDTGYETHHPDLKDALWNNDRPGQGNTEFRNFRKIPLLLLTSPDGIHGDKHGLNPMQKNGDIEDDDGHGTHCAGAIGATTNNDVGVAGLNWGVKIIPCRFIGRGMAVS